MPSHADIQRSPYTPRQLFALVADIERYPEFLPWCRAARVIERFPEKHEMLGELVISFSHMTESYVSRVRLFPPPQEHGEGAIDVEMVRGPFHHLVNRWRFIPVNGGTQIDFFLDFKFKSRVLEKLMGALFSKATSRMVDAFRARADALYGGRP